MLSLSCPQRRVCIKSSHLLNKDNQRLHGIHCLGISNLITLESCLEYDHEYTSFWFLVFFFISKHFFSAIHFIHNFIHQLSKRVKYFMLAALFYVDRFLFLENNFATFNGALFSATQLLNKTTHLGIIKRDLILVPRPTEILAFPCASVHIIPKNLHLGRSIN